jgi:hypothetical protein
MTLQLLHSEFLIYEENFILFFISVGKTSLRISHLVFVLFFITVEEEEQQSCGCRGLWWMHKRVIFIKAYFQSFFVCSEDGLCPEPTGVRRLPSQVPGGHCQGDPLPPHW